MALRVDVDFVVHGVQPGTTRLSLIESFAGAGLPQQRFGIEADLVFAYGQMPLRLQVVSRDGAIVAPVEDFQREFEAIPFVGHVRDSRAVVPAAEIADLVLSGGAQTDFENSNPLPLNVMPCNLNIEEMERFFSEGRTLYWVPIPDERHESRKVLLSGYHRIIYWVPMGISDIPTEKRLSKLRDDLEYFGSAGVLDRVVPMSEVSGLVTFFENV